ncbi:unnamed protein product [Arabidopsis lyrata]|nr:unnamed protein product [Arabidopsis lyrata]
MPELEEANIIIRRSTKELLKSVTSSRRLSLRLAFDSAKETVYPDGIVFNQLEKLELCIWNDDWSKLLVQLLKDSPKLQILNLIVDDSKSYFVGYKPVSWNNNHESSVPTCFLNSLETFKFSGFGKTKVPSVVKLYWMCDMDKITELSDDFLVKILSILPTKEAVSTSVLSKRWEFLWMWLPKLDFSMSRSSEYPRLRDFIDKNLPLHRAPIIESLDLRLRFCSELVKPEDVKSWAGIAVSRCVRELSIYFHFYKEPGLLLPSILYTCKSLVTLKLEGYKILVDVPPTVCLPSLKTLRLRWVKYLKEDSLGLLLSHCPVLEDLSIERCHNDNYFKVVDPRDSLSYLIEHMPELEEADINVKQNIEKLLVSITSVKRLSLQVGFRINKEPVYDAGIVFNQLEHLKLFIRKDYWSKLLVRMLKDSPKLRVLNIYVHIFPRFEEYQPDINIHDLTSPEGISLPKCLLKSLETFEFSGYKGRQEERDFLSFIFKHACCLKSSTISN